MYRGAPSPSPHGGVERDLYSRKACSRLACKSLLPAPPAPRALFFWRPVGCNMLHPSTLPFSSSKPHHLRLRYPTFALPHRHAHRRSCSTRHQQHSTLRASDATRPGARPSGAASYPSDRASRTQCRHCRHPCRPGHPQGLYPSASAHPSPSNMKQSTGLSLCTSLCLDCLSEGAQG